MDEKIRQEFAKNLRKYMIAEGKTQADMCRYMDISSATAAYWYNGKKMPRMDKIQSLANWLGIDMGVLMGEKQISFPDRETAAQALDMVSDPDMVALWKLKQESEERFRAYTKAMLALYGKGL